MAEEKENNPPFFLSGFSVYFLDEKLSQQILLCLYMNYSLSMFHFFSLSIIVEKNYACGMLVR